jgi:outer membrane lipoprotein-sorting protein
MIKQVLFFKKSLPLLFLLVLNLNAVFGQQIVTADRFMEMVSERYGGIRDYQANLDIRSGNSDMYGIVSYISPTFLRIDFSRPAEQVILFNGEMLTIYLPDYRAVLNQSVAHGRRSPASGAGMASAQGLTMLRRNYVPSFVTGPSPEPLDGGNPEMVVKIRLTRRSVSEGFREIILSVNAESRLIRRIEARTIAETELRFDYTNIRTNMGIPEQRFIYDSPPSANMYHNFLFRDTD